MNQQNQTKHNHHIIPKLYLKGFVKDRRHPFVWVYKKGQTFHPGSKSHHNPRKMPISKAGMERDHYAFKERDGSMDYDTYENILESTEKPSAGILNKLRRQQMISNDEKLVFAKYIFYMFKRVSKRAQRMNESWVERLESVMASKFTELDTLESNTPKDDTSTLAKIAEKRREAQDYFEYHSENFMDSEIPLSAMAMESQKHVPQILAAMKWQFFVALEGTEFITGDDPVFNPGLEHSYAEYSFPISKDVALVASWHNVVEGFFDAIPEMVTEINQRVMNNAQNETYSSRKDSSLVELFNNSQDKMLFIYPESAHSYFQSFTNR